MSEGIEIERFGEKIRNVVFRLDLFDGNRAQHNIFANEINRLVDFFAEVHDVKESNDELVQCFDLGMS